MQLPNLVDGINKLDKLKNNKLRAGNDKLKDEIDPNKKQRAIRRMMMFLPRHPLTCLRLWKSKADE